MNKAQALTRLRGMVAAESAPVLSDAEIESLLSMVKVVDAAGLGPAETGYVDTWDLNRAAAEGWRWKAGKCTGAYDFTADGATFNRSQMLEMCNQMVLQYQRRTHGSLPVYAPIAAAYPVEDEE